MKSRLLWVVVLVGACGTVLKPPDPDRSLNVKTQGTMFEADGGFRFAALPEPGSRVVRLDIRYPVGSVDDPPGKEGLAHLVEHLLFAVEIQRDGKKTSIGAELGRVALSWNAMTADDFTHYEVLASAEALDELIALEVDRLAVGCGGLNPSIVDREREVVINELRQRQGASGASLQRMLFESIYPEGHPYRPVDTIESVSRIQFSDVCAFIAGPYQRGIATVVASGMVDGDDLKKAAAAQFGRLRKRGPQTRPAVPVVQPRPATLRLQGDIDEPTLIATWPLPKTSSREYRLLRMVMPYVASRVDAFAFTYGWGHSADWNVIGGEQAPMLAVSVTLTSASKLDDAIAAMKKGAEYVLRATYEGGEDRMSQRWLRKWQGQAESMLATWESLGGRNHLASELLAGQAPGFLVGRIEELHKSSPKEVRDIAAEWLSPTRARYVLLEPSGTASGRSGQTYRGGAEEHGVRVDGSLADRELELPALSMRLTTERYTLGNGLRVMMWPYGQGSVVHGRLVVDSGTAHDPARHEGVSQLVGAQLVSSDVMVFGDRSLAMRVDELVRSLAWELRSPGYELSDEAKDYMRGRLRMQRAKERSTYARSLLAALYGAKHPYARAGMTEDSVLNISRDLVMEWARDHIVPRNAVLILAGQFDAALMKRHIAYNADQVSGGSDSRPVDTAPEPRIEIEWVRGVATKPSPTVELDVLFPGGKGIDHNHAKRLVLAQLLSAELSKLRGARAVTYGFSVDYEPRTAGGLWRISGEADASRAAEAGDTLAKILAEIRANPESYRESFVLARQKVLEGLLMTATSSASIASRMVELARFDLADDHYDQLARNVAKLKLADFHPFLARELAIEQQVFGAFGNADAVDAALAAAKKIER